jgi:Protein of unknown function (DUF2950)
MFGFVGNRANSSVLQLVFAANFAMAFLITGCHKQEAGTAQAAPATFASPDEAGRALANAAKSKDQNEIQRIFGSGSADVISTGDATEDTASLSRFSEAYQVMNRWRRLGDGGELLLVGADNHAFPIPLIKNAAGQWYFDAAAGRDEILARRIGHNEITAIGVCAALVDAQNEYFSQKHGGAKQYARKFISDAGQQDGLYWESPQGSPRSPLGPLVALATDEGNKVQPNQHQPFNGYYFSMLDKQGANAQGGVKNYIVNGKMTGGFAVVAYPAQYGDSGVMTFIVNQNGELLQKDLGAKTNEAALAITEFNPDTTWEPVEQ